MQLAIRDDMTGFEIQRPTFEIGDAAACFGHDQRHRRDIPRPQLEFPQPVNPSARDITEVQYSGTRVPHPRVRIIGGFQKAVR